MSARALAADRPPLALRGVIFDLDGTLADTLPVSFAAYRDIFRQVLGVTFTNPEIRAMFGPSDFGLLEQRLGPAAGDAYPRFLASYRRAHGRCRRPFAGISKLLDTLDRRALRLAIVTGKGADAASITLEQIGLADRFEPIEAGSDQGACKPQAMARVCEIWRLNPQQVISVGDAPSDLRAARQAGVLPVGAAWARGCDSEALAELEPAALFRCVSDLERWVESRL